MKFPASLRTILYALPLLALLAAATLFGISAWLHLSGVAIPLSGWLAIAGGVFFSLLVGGGLMALMFYSSRKGYDEQARHFDERL